MDAVAEQVKHYAVYEGTEGDSRRLGYTFEALLAGVPDAMWALAQHHGSGSYVAVEVPAGERACEKLEDTEPERRVYRLSHGWLEE